MNDAVNKALRYMLQHQDEVMDGLRTGRKVAAVAGGMAALVFMSRSFIQKPQAA